MDASLKNVYTDSHGIMYTKCIHW